MHHLIVDSVSWRIIVRDMQILYNGGNSRRKGSSYRQWAQTIQHYSFSETEKTYWKHLVEEASLVDWKKVPVSNGAIRTSFTLLMGQTKCLLRDCHRAYDTRIHELLLTALGYVLPEITQRQINYITLEAHGRDNIDPDLSITSTVGWYTTMYPFALEIADDWGASISSVKEGLRNVPNNGIGYGTIFGYSSIPLPRISFNYLGQFDQSTSTTSFWKLEDGIGECVQIVMQCCQPSRPRFLQDGRDGAKAVNPVLTQDGRNVGRHPPSSGGYCLSLGETQSSPIMLYRLRNV